MIRATLFRAPLHAVVGRRRRRKPPQYSHSIVSLLPPLFKDEYRTMSFATGQKATYIVICHIAGCGNFQQIDDTAVLARAEAEILRARLIHMRGAETFNFSHAGLLLQRVPAEVCVALQRGSSLRHRFGLCRR